MLKQICRPNSMWKKQTGDLVNIHYDEAKESCSCAHLHIHSHKIKFQPGVTEHTLHRDVAGECKDSLVKPTYLKAWSSKKEWWVQSMWWVFCTMEKMAEVIG